MEPLVSVDLQEDQEQQGPKKTKFDIKTTHKIFTVHYEGDVDEWIEIFYWIRSGCGPRYEKVTAEAQKRHFRRSETMEFLNSKKKEDPPSTLTSKSEAAQKGSTDSIPKSPPSSTKAPPPPSLPAKSLPSSSSTSLPTPPPVSPKTAPASSPSPAPAKTTPPSNPPAKSIPPGSPPAKKEVMPPSPSTPTTTKQDKDSKGKDPEPAKADNPKPPRPAGPPPPKKEGAKKPAEASPPPSPSSAASQRPSVAASHQPLERRPSFSFSAFFGGKSDPPSPSVASPPNTATPSPVDMRGAKPPTTTITKK